VHQALLVVLKEMVGAVAAVAVAVAVEVVVALL
jgi:hypothetical protein